jgi:uncharacterized membrane protein YqhA
VVRGVLNAVPIAVLLLAAVALTIAVVVGAVWLIRRTVPATRQGFHAEISAPMLGVVAALFGLLLAFVIITAYENFIEARRRRKSGSGLARVDRARQLRVLGAGP